MLKLDLDTALLLIDDDAIQLTPICFSMLKYFVQHPEMQDTVVNSKLSVAVLAFNNMSGDQDQEYFSDGITEDIITELARLATI